VPQVSSDFWLLKPSVSATTVTPSSSWSMSLLISGSSSRVVVDQATASYRWVKPCLTSRLLTAAE